MDGRTPDILHLPGPDGARVPVHPSVLGSAVAPFPEGGQYAFVQDATGLHARVVLGPGAAADVTGRPRAALLAAVTSLTPEPGTKSRSVRTG
ncbi:hypothetical protein ACI8AC_00390 [Geodermatophilus sp. SYSU D00758]